MPTLETRVVSGKGILKISPTNFDYKKAKIITVFTSVVRRPISEYLNLHYNPARSRYASLQFMRQGYVVRTEAIEYGSQAFDFYPEISAQTLLAVECAYAGTLQSFANLGSALGLTITGVTNQIANWVWTNLFFDEIKIVCYADTVIRIVAEAKNYDLCSDQTGKEGEPPPYPGANPPVVPPGGSLQDYGISVSPPYSGTNDNGDTVPYDPGDTTPPVPGCWKITATYGGSPTFPPDTIYVYGFETDTPGFVSDGTNWNLRNLGDSRMMYPNWLAVGGTTITLTEATWYTVCPTTPSGVEP